jgi:hypothetical protein
MMSKMRIWSYIKIFFIFWIALTGTQPLLASAMTSSVHEDLSSRNYKLNVLFKLSELKGVLENIESVVELSEGINENALASGQEELARIIMRQAYSSEKFDLILRRILTEDYKPRNVRSIIKWYRGSLGKKILKFENEANDPANRLAMESFTKKLLKYPPSKARINLLERIERSSHLTEAGRTLFLEYVKLLHPFNKKADIKGLRKMLKSLNKNITEPIREVVLRRMLFSYRDIKSKELKEYASFLGSLAGQWLTQSKLKSFNIGIKKASYKAGLIQLDLLKEINLGGPNYPLLRSMVPPGQRYMLIGRRDPFRPLVNQQGVVGSSGSERDRSQVRLFGDELRDIPSLALPVFSKIKVKHPKLYKELTNFKHLFNDRKALEEMTDEEYTEAIKNYRNVLERSADIKMKTSPLQVEYGALRMTGVILKKTKALAMFEVETTSYTLRKGDLIGPSFGTVEEVKDGEVVVSEKFRDYLGNILENQKRIQFGRAELMRVNENL